MTETSSVQPRGSNTRPPIRILIVDDSDDHLRLLSEFVRLCALSTEAPVTCETGEAAIEKLSKESFDCVLLDFDLPGINGVEVLKRARQLISNQCVVMVTAKGDEQIAVEAMKAGAMDYLVKGNVTRQTLERVLLNCIERMDLHKKIAEQEQELIRHEQERVLLESVGATCHHFSQPITSLLGRLELLMGADLPLDEKGRKLLDDCYNCTHDLARILNQFQRIREYRTVPYTEKMNIIDITE